MTVCQSTMAPPQAEPRTAKIRLVTAVVEPTPGDWALFRGAEAMCLEEIRRILAEDRAELSTQERKIIRARFMLGSNLPNSRPQTLEQVGRLVGVSKERVRQLQNRALQKLRAVLEDSLIGRPRSSSSSRR